MNLLLQRQPSANGWTLGKLLIDDQPECLTCEDVVREVPGKPVESWKVQNQTAIPSGRYQVILNVSMRFKRLMPLLLDVQGFSGVRIHSGNTAADTEGCILVGRKSDANGVLESRLAFEPLLTLLKTAFNKGEEIWITIKNA